MQITRKIEKKLNSGVKNYEMFFHTSRFITDKSKGFDIYSDDQEKLRLRQLLGLDDERYFTIEREAWNSVKKDIPLAYLNAIGADLKTIEFTLELDLEEYEKETVRSSSIRFASTKIMKGLYQHLSLPLDITDEKAVEIMKAFSVEIGQKSAIHYPELKLIVFHSDGSIEQKDFVPVLEQMGDSLVRKIADENY